MTGAATGQSGPALACSTCTIGGCSCLTPSTCGVWAFAGLTGNGDRPVSLGCVHGSDASCGPGGGPLRRRPRHLYVNQMLWAYNASKIGLNASKIGLDIGTMAPTNRQ